MKICVAGAKHELQRTERARADPQGCGAHGFTEMTEVQEKAIPPMMEGKDIIAKAPTGTGKTCAFGIPLILGLDQSRNYPQAVVMAPTRELAQQITEDLQDLAHFYPDIRVVTVYGGANIQKQIEKLKKARRSSWPHPAACRTT